MQNFNNPELLLYYKVKCAERYGHISLHKISTCIKKLPGHTLHANLAQSWNPTTPYLSTGKHQSKKHSAKYLHKIYGMKASCQTLIVVNNLLAYAIVPSTSSNTIVSTARPPLSAPRFQIVFRLAKRFPLFSWPAFVEAPNDYALQYIDRIQIHKQCQIYFFGSYKCRLWQPVSEAINLLST